MLKHSHFPILPISYAIPQELIVSAVSRQKDLDFFPCIPGVLSTYIYGIEDETRYHQDYQRSFYAHTRKKGTWDCLRHYEMLANGCVPYFHNIERCPPKSCFRLPKPLLIQAKKIVQYEGGKITRLDLDDYFGLADQLLEYTKQNLTTVSIARYIVEHTVRRFPESVLVLTGDPTIANNCRDLFLHGFKQLLGERVVDFPKVDFLYKCSREQEMEFRRRLHGKGFSYGFRLDDLPVDRTNIIARVLQKEFDLIVVAIVTRQSFVEFMASDLLSAIVRYPPSAVAFIDGCDYDQLFPGTQIAAQAGSFFKLEAMGASLQPAIAGV